MPPGIPRRSADGQAAARARPAPICVTSARRSMVTICRRPRQGRAELPPAPLLIETRAFDRRAKHVVDDHQPRLGREHEPFGRKRTMAHMRHGFVQRGGIDQQLSQQAERAIEFKGNQSPFGDGQQVREPDARDVVRGDDDAWGCFERRPTPRRRGKDACWKDASSPARCRNAASNPATSPSASWTTTRSRSWLPAPVV